MGKTQSCLETLTAVLGFDEKRSREALAATKGSLERAAHLLMHEESVTGANTAGTPESRPAVAPLTKWACGACTFENVDLEATACGLCGTRRAAPEEAAVKT